MSQYFEVHPDNPQPRLLKQAAQILQQGGIAAVPTDSSYALVCRLDDKAAAQESAPAAPGGRQAPPDAAVPRLERTGQLCAGGQPAVPAAQAGHARALHLHPRSHQGGAAPAEPPFTPHHRPARSRPQGDAGAAGDPRSAAAGHDADPAGPERTDERPAADPRALPEDAAGGHRRRRLPDAADHRHRPGKRRRRPWCASAAANWRGWV